MSKGRPSLEENPHAGRMLVRNFIDKYGLDKMQELFKLGVQAKSSRSSISRQLDIGFGTVSRMYNMVFKVNRRSISIDRDIKEFMKLFYDVEL